MPWELLITLHRTILLESLGVHSFHLRWIARESIESLQRVRMETYRELLGILGTHEKSKF
jgi:hypothetical protein